MKLLITAVVLLAIGARADAQPAAAQAEVMFRNGKRLLKQGKVAEACAAFDASQKLEPTVSTLLNQANCRERNNQLATAWGLFLDAERDTRSAGDEAGKQLHQVAVEHADKLEPRLSTLEIKVPADMPVAGLEIRRDNDVIDPAAWNQALPIDGGTYKISAKAPGAAPWSTTVTIANEKDAKSVEIPRPTTGKRTEPVRQPPPVAPPPPPRAPKQPPATARPSDAPDTWFCTGSTRVKFGVCKPQLAACDALRDKMLAQIRDLPACNAEDSATCFKIGSDAHCAPTAEICEAMHLSAERAGTAALGSCELIRSRTAAQKIAIRLGSGDLDDDAGWSCTQSTRSDEIGTCKPTHEQCEEFRAKLLERFPDLSACHGYAHAMCFDVGKDPHCAPNRELCESLRAAAMKQSGAALPRCTSRAAPK